MDKQAYLSAMRATDIPPGESGLWNIVKAVVEMPVKSIYHAKIVTVPAGRYTLLRRLTTATLHKIPPGEIVMEDTIFELQSHLGFVMQAYGKVLITGLGLGCVIRGLLVNPKVRSIVCIENSKDVLKLVGPYIKNDRLEIIHADALQWTADNYKQQFDCAWHDLWSNRENDEPHLDVIHTKLFINCKSHVAKQGAWGYDRTAKKILLQNKFPWIG